MSEEGRLKLFPQFTRYEAPDPVLVEAWEAQVSVGTTYTESEKV